MTALTLLGATASSAAGLSKMVLGEHSPFSVALDSLTDKISSGAFAGFGAFGTSDSYNRKNPLQLLAQTLAVIVPLFGSSEDLTMLRRPEVGFANIAADMEKLSGKGKVEGYKNFEEGFDVSKTALKNYLKAMKENPIKALFDYESGTAGVNAGLLTSFSLVPYLLGAKKLGSVMGQAAGMALEFASKFNKDSLDKGRYALFASGALMTGSSFLNMVKEFLPENMHKAVENGTWALNLFGKQAQLQAYNNGELALTQKQDYKLSDLPGRMMKAILGNANQTQTIESVIGNGKDEAVVQTQKNNSGDSHFNLRPSFVRSSSSSSRRTSFASASKATIKPRIYSGVNSVNSSQTTDTSSKQSANSKYVVSKAVPAASTINTGLSVSRPTVAKEVRSKQLSPIVGRQALTPKSSSVLKPPSGGDYTITRVGGTSFGSRHKSFNSRKASRVG
jgi:hypothetical protein